MTNRETNLTTNPPLEGALLRVSDVRKSYPGVDGAPPLEILRGVSLQLRTGETVAVTGASGGGKSTLLSIIAGLDRPTSGHVEVDGHRWSDTPARELNAFRARTVGIVFQQFHLLEHLTALENVRLPLDLASNRDLAPSYPDDRARELLARVGLGARFAHLPSRLSRGEQQRCAIARALAAKPKILLADEPTGSLDAHTGQAVIDLIFELVRDLGLALLLVTHDPNVAVRCARRFSLDEGLLLSSPQAPE